MRSPATFALVIKKKSYHGCYDNFNQQSILLVFDMEIVLIFKRFDESK